MTKLKLSANPKLVTNSATKKSKETKQTKTQPEVKLSSPEKRYVATIGIYGDDYFFGTIEEIKNYLLENYDFSIDVTLTEVVGSPIAAVFGFTLTFVD